MVAFTSFSDLRDADTRERSDADNNMGAPTKKKVAPPGSARKASKHAKEVPSTPPRVATAAATPTTAEVEQAGDSVTVERLQAEITKLSKSAADAAAQLSAVMAEKASMEAQVLAATAEAERLAAALAEQPQAASSSAGGAAPSAADLEATVAELRTQKAALEEELAATKTRQTATVPPAPLEMAVRDSPGGDGSSQVGEGGSAEAEKKRLETTVQQLRAQKLWSVLSVSELESTVTDLRVALRLAKHEADEAKENAEADGDEFEMMERTVAELRAQNQKLMAELTTLKGDGAATDASAVGESAVEAGAVAREAGAAAGSSAAAKEGADEELPADAEEISAENERVNFELLKVDHHATAGLAPMSTPTPVLRPCPHPRHTCPPMPAFRCPPPPRVPRHAHSFHFSRPSKRR